MTPWTAAHQTSLSFPISQSLLKFMSIEWVMLSIVSRIDKILKSDFLPSLFTHPTSKFLKLFTYRTLNIFMVLL